MTLEELRAKVREWDLQATVSGVEPAHYSTILNQLDYHAAREWRVYLPTEHHPDFNRNYMDRLARWVSNLADETDQKLLLEYALYISFFSHDDFVAFYRTAYNREITRWVATHINARLEPQGLQAFNDHIKQELHDHTWFCPITDSMDINEFHKVNHIKGVGHRPFFTTLQMVAEHPTAPNSQIAADWIRYMKNPSPDPFYTLPPLKRLVLLEDIVGSGTQCLDAIHWAVTNLETPILFIPLILCPNGVEALRAEEKLSGGRLTVRPVIELRRGELIGPERHGELGWPITVEIEKLAKKCAARVSGGKDTFGYKNTGCSLATFSNTPDNTLPMVHHKPGTGTWEPLFPRVYRD